MSYNETISDDNYTAYLQASLKVLEEVSNVMGEWNGDESGILEDRFNAAEELKNYIMASVAVIEELQS